jgi:TonB family protein
MSPFRIVSPVAVLLLCFGMVRSARSQESSAVPPKPVMSAPEYAESPDGLKSFLGDALDAMKSGDHARVSSCLSNLAIPDHNAWFAKIFGPEEGRRLEVKYQELLPQLPEAVSKVFKYALDGHRTDIEIKMFQKPVDPKARLIRAVTEAMIHPIALYSATGNSSSEKFGAVLGNYVYVDGAFRYLDMEVYLALSTAPPLRIRQGGNVTAATLVHRADAIYPDEAKASRTQGRVVLHVVIGVDGAVIESEAVSGDPVLVKAAIDAVRQWKYKPTLLNGKPVEVDTTVTLDFNL